MLFPTVKPCTGFQCNICFDILYPQKYSLQLIECFCKSVWIYHQNNYFTVKCDSVDGAAYDDIVTLIKPTGLEEYILDESRETTSL